jgi:hypothetical protein
MDTHSIKRGVCSLYQIKDDEYKAFMLKRGLFKRVRIVRPFIDFFNSDYLFNEKRLVDKIGQAETLKEIQEEIDFYQHKYVVNSVLKDALRFRISGMRLMRICNQALNHLANSTKSDTDVAQ